MWPFRQRSTDARNLLFDAALEFGKNWRRDVASLAAERLPELDQAARDALVTEIETTRHSIEDWILSRWDSARANWSKADAKATRTYILSNYPWMDRHNVAQAINQGTYYAWHG